MTRALSSSSSTCNLEDHGPFDRTLLPRCAHQLADLSHELRALHLARAVAFEPEARRIPPRLQQVVKDGLNRPPFPLRDAPRDDDHRVTIVGEVTIQRDLDLHEGLAGAPVDGGIGATRRHATPATRLQVGPHVQGVDPGSQPKQRLATHGRRSSPTEQPARAATACTYAKLSCSLMSFGPNISPLHLHLSPKAADCTSLHPRPWPSRAGKLPGPPSVLRASLPPSRSPSEVLPSGL